MAGEFNPTPLNESWLYNPVFPAHWKRGSLYTLANWVNGLAFRNIQFSPTGKPVIRIAEIKVGITGQTKFTTQTFDHSVYITDGDMLFSWSGQPETSIDAFWWRGPDGWLNQHIFKVTPNPEIDRTFFFYLLRYLKPNFVAIARNKQTTGLGHVTRWDLEQINVAFPENISEQRAIAHILGTLDDKIELNLRMNRTLEEMARAIFKSWFVDFDPVRAKAAVRREHPDWTNEQVSRLAIERARGSVPLQPEIAELFPDRFVDSELGEIPEGWDASTIGQHFRITMGQSPPGNTYNETGEGLPFYQGRTDFGFRFPTRRVYCTAPTRYAEPGDTLVSVRAPVGDVNMANERCAVGRGVAAIRHCSGSRSFTYYCIHHLGDHFAKFEAEGTVFGCINKADFERLPFSATSPEILALFDRVVSPLDEKIENSERQTAILAALRDALLPKIISGALRVKDAERFLKEQGL